MLRTARFLSAFLTSSPEGIEEAELPLDGTDEEGRAIYLRPTGRAPLPGWIVLHGITVPGARHAGLLRFAGALARSGAAVLIPEIPAWSALRIDAVAGERAILAGIRWLRERPDVQAGRINLVGFSFGATHALSSAALPEIGPEIGGIVAFGGYADLERAIRALLTGEQEWRGLERRLDPDPYGRWIAVANFLTEIPNYRGMERVARAAHTLALEAGHRGVYAGGPDYDELKSKLRASLHPDELPIWELIAPPAGREPDPEPGRQLAHELTQAARRCVPQLDPRPRLRALDQRIVLAHGYDDRLIPYSESLRLRELLPPHLEASVCITRLFGHSRESERLSLLRYPGELLGFCRLLTRALRPS